MYKRLVLNIMGSKCYLSLLWFFHTITWWYSMKEESKKQKSIRWRRALCTQCMRNWNYRTEIRLMIAIKCIIKYIELCIFFCLLLFFVSSAVNMAAKILHSGLKRESLSYSIFSSVLFSLSLVTWFHLQINVHIFYDCTIYILLLGRWEKFRGSDIFFHLI